MPARRLSVPNLLPSLLLLATTPLLAQSNPAWTTPIPPIHIADNLWYVGSQDLAAYLITTPAGDILLNENLTSSPDQIARSIEQTGHHLADVKILLCSHAHFDHIAGAAELRRRTHAQFALMDADVPAAESGGRKDPTLPHDLYPPVHVDRILHDGDPVTLGDTTLIAHKTAGHTPGTTTFTFTTHLQGKPEHVIIVGSWSVLDDYRLVPSPGHPATYPGIAQDFQHTFQLLNTLPVDIFLAAHGSMFDLLAKAPQAATNPAIWIDPTGYHAALDQAHARFEHILAQQTTHAASKTP